MIQTALQEQSPQLKNFLGETACYHHKTTVSHDEADLMRRLAYKFFDGLNSVTFVKRFPHLRDHVTDLLIGDLFNERLDEIIEPLETPRAEQEAASSKKTKKKTATRGSRLAE